MIHALTMPAWGMEDAPGTVVAWLLNEGDYVARAAELVEIETSKLTNVVESPFAGQLRKIVLGVGDTAPTGALLAVVVEGEASDAEVDAFIAQHAPAETEAKDSGPTERTVETARGGVHLVSHGSEGGRPTVLLHGFGADWTSWSFVLNGLARKRPVHLIDLPGHGSSFKSLGDAPLAALVDAVVESIATLDGPVHLVGHSLGGLVAVLVAEKVPDAVASVSLVAPAGLGNPISGEFLEKFVESDSRRNARAAIEMLVSDKDSVSLTMINDVIRARRVEGAKEALHSLRTAISADDTQTVDVRPALALLDIPVQLIVAAHDQIIRPGDAPGGLAETYQVEGTGHLLHMEQAAEVQKLLEKFMERGDD